LLSFFVPRRLLASLAQHVTERLAVNKPASRYPQRIGDLLDRCLGEVFAQQGFASTAVVTHWPEIVGSDVAAHCEPIKLQWPRGDIDAPEPATLVLRAEGPAAIEIQHLSDTIIERVNRFFGWRAVKRIAIRQAPLTGGSPSRARNSPLQAAQVEIPAGLSDIADEGLRSALARLGAALKRP
jgi:hypothetical protein